MENIDIKYFQPNKRTPIIGNFEITRKCPFNCVICYNEIENKLEMSLEEIKKYVDELANLGCMYINLTGGDPLVREDFIEIYEYVVKAGIKPSVETNGLLLTDSHIQVFKKYPPEKLHISFYGVDDEVLQRTIKANYSSAQIISNLKKLKQEGVEFTLRTPFSTLNIENAHKIYELTKELDVPFKSNVKVFWKQSGERCYQYRCTTEIIKPLVTIHPIYENLYEKVKYLESNIIKRRDCYTGIYDFNISAYAEINFCIVYWKPVYNLRNGSISDAWDNWYIHFRNIKNNHCVGKNIFLDNECSWGYMYSNTNVDCTKGLNERIKEKFNEYLSMGKNESDYCKEFNISKESLDYILNL